METLINKIKNNEVIYTYGRKEMTPSLFIAREFAEADLASVVTVIETAIHNSNGTVKSVLSGISALARTASPKNVNEQAAHSLFARVAEEMKLNK